MPLTIIKILSSQEEFKPSLEDIKRWKDMLSEGLLDNDKDVEVEIVPDPSKDDNYLTLVRIGSENYHPTVTDLEEYRQIFEAAKDDPDFIMITPARANISVDIIKMSDVVAVE